MDYVEAVKDLVIWLMKFKNDSNWKSHFKAYADYSDDPFNYNSEDSFIAAAIQPARAMHPGFQT